VGDTAKEPATALPVATHAMARGRPPVKVIPPCPTVESQYHPAMEAALAWLSMTRRSMARKTYASLIRCASGDRAGYGGASIQARYGASRGPSPRYSIMTPLLDWLGSHTLLLQRENWHEPQRALDAPLHHRGRSARCRRVRLPAPRCPARAVREDECQPGRRRADRERPGG